MGLNSRLPTAFEQHRNGRRQTASGTCHTESGPDWTLPARKSCGRQRQLSNTDTCEN